MRGKANKACTVGLYSFGSEKVIVDIQDCQLQDKTANAIFLAAKAAIPGIQQRVRLLLQTQNLHQTHHGIGILRHCSFTYVKLLLFWKQRTHCSSLWCTVSFYSDVIQKWLCVQGQLAVKRIMIRKGRTRSNDPDYLLVFFTKVAQSKLGDGREEVKFYNPVFSSLSCCLSIHGNCSYQGLSRLIRTDKNLCLPLHDAWVTVRLLRPLCDVKEQAGCIWRLTSPCLDLNVLLKNFPLQIEAQYADLVKDLQTKFPTLGSVHECRGRLHLRMEVDCFALLCFALLCFALLCFALLCFALLCFALLCFALLCFALLCFALLCFALLCFALLCFALLCLLQLTYTRHIWHNQLMYRPVTKSNWKSSWSLHEDRSWETCSYVAEVVGLEKAYPRFTNFAKEAWHTIFVNGLQFRVHALAFFQTNTEQAGKLVDMVYKAAGQFLYLPLLCIPALHLSTYVTQLKIFKCWHPERNDCIQPNFRHQAIGSFD